MAKRWRIRPHNADQIRSLERSARVPSVVAQLLLARGISDPQLARSFLDARMGDLRDPNSLPGVPEAADRIHRAVAAKRRIDIYGDYDADGMTGSAVLYACLRMLHADVGYYVPNRLSEGYGLNDHALQRIAFQGGSLVVSVDCGIGSVAEAETAKQLGLELIVTDHHEIGEELPSAAAIVHPRLPGHNYPFSGLCGAGVAFKLAWAICQRASESEKVTDRMRRFLVAAMGVAAIGTVADVVPLVDENRVLVRHGLNSLLRSPPVGLAALLKITELDRKRSLGSEDIAFTIAPRLNAAGRLGQAQLGVELLTTQNPERAEALAQYINELNGNRESLERSIYLAANKQAKEEFDVENDPALVLAGHGWHPGVIGIVAGRLAEKYYRPVIVISLDQAGAKPGVGSARTAGSFHLYNALSECQDNLLGFGGHAAAAGLQLESTQLDAFRADFCEFAAGEIEASDRIAEVRIDGEAPLAQLTWQTVKQIEQLAPFGQGNPRPVLCASGVELSGPPRKVGAGERHLLLRLRQDSVTLKAIAFGQADWAEPLESIQQPVDIAYRPILNEFKGMVSVELQLVDWRPTTVAPAGPHRSIPSAVSVREAGEN